MSTPAAPTSSAVVATTASASHVLRIDGYSRTTGLATGVYLRSRSFAAGGRSWHLAYLPRGSSPDAADYISLFLVLDFAPSGPPVLAEFTMSLLGRAGRPVPAHTKTMPVTEFAAARSRGFPRFVRRDTLERSRKLLRDDSFAVRCDVTVVTQFRTEAGVPGGYGAVWSSLVPPPDLPRHLGELLASARGADVRFRVDGEDFPAHRCVLAARSPVFTAQLFGAMKEAAPAGGSSCGAVVEVHDMRADVFRNLLHFIYTDALPEPELEPGRRRCADEEEEEALMMAQHLLVAADRYAVERLKAVCEATLSRHIHSRTLATTLALAEQHRCAGLKDACVEFLRHVPGALDAVVATEGFDHLASTCPSLIKELMSKLAAR